MFVRITSLLFALRRKDIKVTMKKQYNQENRVLKKLLSGDEWYCQQTFRALNQAVGEWDICLLSSRRQQCYPCAYRSPFEVLYISDEREMEVFYGVF